MRRRELMEGLKITILAVAGVLAVSSANASDNNKAIQQCLDSVGYDRTAPVEQRFEGVDISAAARCYHDYKKDQQIAALENMQEFLAANPRYRYPGQSNNRCWGKPREMPFTSATISATPFGFTAGVSYKDTMPAGCYETGPWDNREGTHAYDG